MCKVAIIAGANGGIGRLLAQHYIANEYLVIGLDKTPSGVCEYTSYIEVGTDFICFTKDRKYRSNIVGEFISHLPSVTGEFVVVKNAAEQILKPVPDIRREDWEQSLAVNTIAEFFHVRALIGVLGASREHVINISSVHAKLTKSNVISYATSKTAIEGIIRTLALQLSPLGISIDAVAPATIAKQMRNAGFSWGAKETSRIRELPSIKKYRRTRASTNFVNAITDQKNGLLIGFILEFNG